MTRLVATLLFVAAAAGVWRAADDPPKKLADEEGKKLQDEGKAFNAAGNQQYREGKLAEATESYQKALAVARRLFPKEEYPDGHAIVALSATNLAVALRDQQKYPEAETLLREALGIQQRLYPKQDNVNLALILNTLGEVLDSQGKHTEAEALLREALGMRQRLFKGDHPNVAASLTDLAHTLSELGKDADAEALYRDALAMYKRLYKGDHPLVARGLGNVAAVLDARGRYAEAEELARESLEMHRRLHPKQDHVDVAVGINNVAAILQDRGKLAEAEALYRDSLAMYRRLFPDRDHPRLWAATNNLAGALKAGGKYSDAEALYRAALAMSQRLYPDRDHPTTATALNNLGSLLQARGAPTEAEPVFRAALEMRQRLFPKQDHPDLVYSLNNVGLALSDLGKHAEAERSVRAALEMGRRLYPKQDHPNLAVSLERVGHILWDQRKYAAAEPFYRDALEMYRRMHPDRDHTEVAGGLNNLANVLNQLQKPAEAERLHRDALAMRRRLYLKQDHPDVASSLNNLAAVLQDRGHYAEAEQLLREALEMKRRLHGNRDNPDTAIGLNNLASLLLDRGKYDEAGDLFLAARRMHRALVATYAGGVSEGDALTLLASLPRSRDAFLSTALAARTGPGKVYPEVWADKGAVARLYEQRQQAARAATDPAVARLTAELADARRRRAELLLAPETADPATAKQRGDDLQNLDRTIARLDRAIRPLLPAVERAEKLARATPAELQKLLPADAAVVDYLRFTHFEHDKDKPGRDGEKEAVEYLAFVVTRDRIALVELGPAAPIEAAVNLWRQAIVSAREIPAAIPDKARELVWAKVRQQLPAGVKTVYVSPDVVLCRVPWAALPGDKPGTILLEDFAVATVPHGSFLLDHLWPREPAKKVEGVLVVGGVNYDAAPAPAGQPAPTRGPVATPGAKLTWSALPGSAAEATGVAGVAGRRKLPVAALRADQATVPAVLAELPKVRSAHLATHGFFADPEFRSVQQLDPKLFEMSGPTQRVGPGALSPLVMTGLVLAGANHPNTPGRGIITGEALIDLDLSGLELAVLSACETGLGDLAGGEGTFGLQRAFHYAGTTNVVASLWKVPDRPTAALMGEFYRNLWDKNLGPAEALRQAQLTIYRNPGKIAELAEGFRGPVAVVAGQPPDPAPPPTAGTAHPLLWAAFTLSGPGR